MPVQFFSSSEEMFQAMADAQAVADSQVRVWQDKIKIGDLVVRVIPQEDAIVYSRILDPVESDREAGADEDELEYLRKVYAQPHMKNYRFTQSFSAMVPDGEFGDMHVVSASGMMTQKQWDAAKAAGWPQDPNDLVDLLKANIE